MAQRENEQDQALSVTNGTDRGGRRERCGIRDTGTADQREGEVDDARDQSLERRRSAPDRERQPCG